MSFWAAEGINFRESGQDISIGSAIEFNSEGSVVLLISGKRKDGCTPPPTEGLILHLNGLWENKSEEGGGGAISHLYSSQYACVHHQQGRLSASRLPFHVEVTGVCRGGVSSATMTMARCKDEGKETPTGCSAKLKQRGLTTSFPRLGGL